MNIDLIDGEKEFYELEGIWKSFQSQGFMKDITMTWEWISTWWSVFNKDRTLTILVVYENNEIVAIAPFVKRNIKHFYLLPYKRIEFLASGEDEFDEICSDYLDIIMESSKTQQIMEAIFQYLHDADNIFWDEIFLTRLKDE